MIDLILQYPYYLVIKIFNQYYIILAYLVYGLDTILALKLSNFYFRKFLINGDLDMGY